MSFHPEPDDNTTRIVIARIIVVTIDDLDTQVARRQLVLPGLRVSLASYPSPVSQGNVAPRVKTIGVISATND
jgi:hypothetical protein